MRISDKNFYPLIGLFTLLGDGYLLYKYNFASSISFDRSFCLFKNITTRPCPACGSTRAVLALLHGNLIESILLNPLGVLILIGLAISPLWILRDILLKSDSFYHSYRKFERLVQKPPLTAVFIFVVISIWGWNIIQGH